MRHLEVSLNEIVQIKKEEWGEIADPLCIAVLPLVPSEFEEQFSVVFESKIENGLGEILSAVVHVNEVKYWLESCPQGGGVLPNVQVYILSNEPNSLNALKNIIDTLGIDRSDLKWEQENLGKAHWVLYRVDDNGNEIEMYRFNTKLSAEHVKGVYESRGHKQAYIVSNDA